MILMLKKNHIPLRFFLLWMAYHPLGKLEVDFKEEEENISLMIILLMVMTIVITVRRMRRRFIEGK